MTFIVAPSGPTFFRIVLRLTLEEWLMVYAALIDDAGTIMEYGILFARYTLSVCTCLVANLSKYLIVSFFINIYMWSIPD